MSTIEDLVKLIKHSFSEREFEEVQNMLVDREKNMKIEMENLKRDNESIRKEVRLLERTQGLVELEKSKLKDKLQMSQRKCEDLNERITRLVEEQKVCNDRAKRAEERYGKVSEENFKLVREKNKTIFELNEKINELKNKNLENERLVEVYEEKFKSLDSRVVIMSQEIENLKNKKMAADQTVEELRRKESEATQTVDGLRLQKLKSDKEVELYKSRLESLATRITKVEAALADILNVKPEDLPSVVDELDKLISAEGGNAIFQEVLGDKDNSGNGRTLDREDDDAKIVVMSPGAHATCNSTGSGSIGLSKKGGRNLDQSSAVKKNAAKTIKINPGSQSHYNPSHTENKDEDLDNGCKGLQSSGPHVSVPCSESRAPVKMASSNFTAGNIIEIDDSDDETNPSGEAYVSDIGKNKTGSEKFAQSQSCRQANKRNRSESSHDSLINVNTKSKRSTCRRKDDDSLMDGNDIQLLESTRDRIGSIDARLRQEKAGGAFDSQTPLKKFNPLNDGDSSDSDDESYSDEHMDNLVASLKSRKNRKWMFKADMLQAFQDDAQLCMNAVCTLYRQQLFAEKSTRCPNSSKTGGFSHFDSISGRSLASYLIDGDPELKLRKSVNEVKKERPDVLGQCKRLATTYIEKLYEIYCAGKDPFFG